MSTPNFDSLHIKLSRAIADPVTPASTAPSDILIAAQADGNQATSVLRTEYLNRANKFLQNIIRGYGIEAVNTVLPGLIKTSNTTFTAYRSLPADCSYLLGVQKASGGRATRIDGVAKPDLENNDNPNITLAYTILGSTVYVYENGSPISNGAHVLYYLKTDEISTLGGATDIAVDNLWYDTIIDIAASFFFTDLGDLDKANKCVERAMSSIRMIMGG